MMSLTESFNTSLHTSLNENKQKEREIFQCRLLLALFWIILENTIYSEIRVKIQQVLTYTILVFMATLFKGKLLYM